MLAFISWFSVPCRTYSFSSRGSVAHSSDCSQKGYLSYCISVGHVCHPTALWWPQRPQLCDSWSPLGEALTWAHSSSERNTVGMVSPGLYLSYHDSFLGVWCLFFLLPCTSQPAPLSSHRLCGLFSPWNWDPQDVFHGSSHSVAFHGYLGGSEPSLAMVMV